MNLIQEIQILAIISHVCIFLELLILQVSDVTKFVAGTFQASLKAKSILAMRTNQNFRIHWTILG